MTGLHVQAGESTSGARGSGVECEGVCKMFDYETTDVVLHINHGKTDKHGNFTPLDITIPRGPLSFLLLAHITAGQEVLVGGDINDPYRIMPLFLSGGGNAFSDATFCQWWKALLKRSAPHIPHFAPTLARTSFVENYTSEYGLRPEMWDGAAAIMGNSVNTWFKNYNPRHRNKKAQEVVAMHSRYVKKQLDGSMEQGSIEAVDLSKD
jgi:hypothetical protein